jgi:hypothetical protein
MGGYLPCHVLVLDSGGVEDIWCALSGRAADVTHVRDPQLTALRSEARRRGLQLPGRFAVPYQRLWQRGYAAEAGRSLLARARTLDEATAMVTPFLDPLLDGSARGR